MVGLIWPHKPPTRELQFPFYGWRGKLRGQNRLAGAVVGGSWSKGGSSSTPRSTHSSPSSAVEWALRGGRTAPPSLHSGPMLMSRRQSEPTLGITRSRFGLWFGCRLGKPPPLFPGTQFPHLNGPSPVQLTVLRTASVRLRHMRLRTSQIPLTSQELQRLPRELIVTLFLLPTFLFFPSACPSAPGHGI